MKILFLLLILLYTKADVIVCQSFELEQTRERTAYGIPCTDFYFDVEVNNIPTRKVKVRRFLPTNPIGTLILTAGGTGKSSYLATYGVESQYIIDSLYNQNYAIWDIQYEDENGWSEHCEGIGSYHSAIQIYSELVKYLYENYFENKEVVFATGNSGGSFQIAFGLAKFGMESIFDMVILTGGPPISDLKKGIFGDNSDLEKWPNGVVGGFALTDYLMGWKEERYCSNRAAPDSIINILDTVSLVSTESERKYSYKTLVNFVQSDDPTNAHHQARLYYDAIKTKKEWYELQGVDIHAVPSSQQGAQKIMDLIVGYTAENTTRISSNIENELKIYPNPFKNKIALKTDKKIISIEIVSVSGQLIANSSITNLDTSKWSSGVYIVYITTIDGKTIVQKIIKE